VIPEGNVINIPTSTTLLRERGVSLDSVDVRCYTTKGYENPVWMMSSDGFSLGLIAVGNSSIMLPDGDILSVSVVQISPYESRITIDTSDVNITANLLCGSQSTPGLQYSIVITTSKLTCTRVRLFDSYFINMHP